jgi:hypothetical protein
MESLKKLIQICRLHYEKILLVIMLLVLAVAVWILYQESQTEKVTIETKIQELKRTKVKTIKEVDLAGHHALMEKAQNPMHLEFSGQHNVLNPVKWLRRSDGSLIKVQTGKEVGPEALIITRDSPLKLTIALDGAAGNGFNMTVTNEAIALPVRDRKPFVSLTSTNAANTRFFTLKEVKGPADNPELVLQMKDTLEPVTVSKSKPFTRIEGYEVDLKYPNTGRTFTKLRASTNSVVQLDGENYKVVAISEKAVVLSADLNNRQYTITQMAGP